MSWSPLPTTFPAWMIARLSWEKGMYLSSTSRNSLQLHESLTLSLSFNEQITFEENDRESKSSSNRIKEVQEEVFLPDDTRPSLLETQEQAFHLESSCSWNSCSRKIDRGFLSNETCKKRFMKPEKPNPVRDSDYNYHNYTCFSLSLLFADTDVSNSVEWQSTLHQSKQLCRREGVERSLDKNLSNK